MGFLGGMMRHEYKISKIINGKKLIDLEIKFDHDLYTLKDDVNEIIHKDIRLDELNALLKDLNLDKDTKGEIRRFVHGAELKKLKLKGEDKLNELSNITESKVSEINENFAELEKYFREKQKEMDLEISKLKSKFEDLFD